MLWEQKNVIQSANLTAFKVNVRMSQSFQADENTCTKNIFYALHSNTFPLPSIIFELIHSDWLCFAGPPPNILHTLEIELIDDN